MLIKTRFVLCQYLEDGEEIIKAKVSFHRKKSKDNYKMKKKKIKLRASLAIQGNPALKQPRARGS